MINNRKENQKSPDKISESAVKQYNQNNIYNLLKKIKSHKEEMNRELSFRKERFD